MRTLALGLFVFALLAGGMAGAWYAMNTWAAGFFGRDARARRCDVKRAPRELHERQLQCEGAP